MRLLGDPALAPLWGRLPDGTPGWEKLLVALGETIDPDAAVLGLVRLMEPGADQELVEVLCSDDERRRRLLAILGGSVALTDHLVRHRDHWQVAADPDMAPSLSIQDAVRDALSVSAEEGIDALRVAYRRALVGIAATDLTCADPLAHLPVAASDLAGLADAALQAALLIAQAEVGPSFRKCRLAVIAMGKTGGRELNYISDVDVLFVAEPAPGAVEDDALAIGHQVAMAVMRACSAPTSHGSLWSVDAALRPEGKQGPLVRTVASHRQYYQRWAKTWEFQALLKARYAAGDHELAAAYLDLVRPMVWEAAGRENFVEDVQAMRRRVEAHLPPAEAARQLKLGRGGLRDVEFSVQLLQLVHGRTDESLRSATTLEALDALGQGGYIAREDAARLDMAYRVLRCLEHRIQLHKLRRTHLMPTDESDLRRVGRAVGLRIDPARRVVDAWQSEAREVRRIHEKLFYRPLLAAAARLTTDEAGLTTQAARDRLQALGFRDPAGAMRHLEALITGVSRRAAIQRQLLPVMLGWFAAEADPDAGLLSFRRVSDELGTTHWYLKMLRDEGSAAEHLARILGRSRYAAELLLRSPETVRVLGEADGLRPRTTAQLVAMMGAAVARHDDPDRALAAVREIRADELVRITFADLVGDLDVAGVGVALSDLTAATLAMSLACAIDKVGLEPVTDIALIGMGSLGGAEMAYSSDADLIAVHRPRDGVAESEAQVQAVAVIQELMRMLGAAGPDPVLGVDLDLRPEGKNGPIVRSIDSYRTYYQRWADTWEFQALLRARPVAGDASVTRQFMAMIDEYRYPAGGLDQGAVREIRRLKARMESERLPRGADPRMHVKLGTGGLTDVEWTVQLLQLNHAHAHHELQVTGTMAALNAAMSRGLIGDHDGQVLIQAWQSAASIRNGNLLWRGRASDMVPPVLRDADGVGRIIGCEPSSGAELAEMWLGVARRSRSVVQERFYVAS